MNEFSLLQECAVEAGIPWRGRPDVVRRGVEVAPGRQVSALVWDPAAEPRLVLVHGGMQNAHTWDTVALALAQPLVAVDLAGHGRSDPIAEPYDPDRHAADLAVAVARLAPSARLVAGMSLGGLGAICVAARRPELVARLAVLDITPGLVPGRRDNPEMLRLMRVESFASFDELLDQVAAANPGRSASSLRRGLVHNTRQREDGRWEWRSAGVPRRPHTARQPYAGVWRELEQVRCPVTLVRGGRSKVVAPEDEREFLRRRPGARVVVVDGAGHSIQGSQPVALARLLGELADAPLPA